MHHVRPARLASLALLAAALLSCASSRPADAVAPASPNPPNKIRVLIVTAGHRSQTDSFLDMFQKNPDVTFATAEQTTTAEAYDRPDLSSFDVVVLYDAPVTITDAQKARFLSLIERGTGFVVMHDALLSYQDWPAYERVAGGKYLLRPERKGDTVTPASTCKKSFTLSVNVVAQGSPITASLQNFTQFDELYRGVRMGRDVVPLLETGGEPLAWTRQEGKSRVVGTVLGHGSPAYANPPFRAFVAQSIRWAAKKS